jgi:hypothetical protein
VQNGVSLPFDKLSIVSKRRRLSTAGSIGTSTMTSIMTTDHPFLEKGQFALLIAAIIVLLIFALTFVY